MKKAIVFLLLGLLLFQNSGRLIVLAWFKLYQPEIVRTLCENRDRPQLHCDGKCVLAKKLAAADQQQQSARWEQLTEVSVFMAPQVPVYAFAPASLPLADAPLRPYRAGVPPSPILPFFHPPCA